MTDRERTVYTDLGVRPVVNAAGSKTVMGGSRLSPAVQEAALVANRHFVVMEELQKRSGETLARMLHADMALVTPGCAAAMTLGVAGIMSGTDPANIAQLPDTTGMRNEIIIQKCQRYSYDRALTLCGARLVEVGDEEGATLEEVKAALTPNTAAIHFLAVGYRPSSLPFEALRDLAHENGIRILVDAASLVYPLERMTWYTRNGADLVCFGAKYFGGFNGTGILCGVRDLMEAAIAHSFVSFETRQNRAFGRPFKLDRQEIVGVVAAMREWFEMDHEDRLEMNQARCTTVLGYVQDVNHATARAEMSDSTISDVVTIELDEAALGLTAQEVQDRLLAGDPSIVTMVDDNVLTVIVNQLYEGEADIVGQKLQALLSG